jgi:hypothetical protein
VAAFLVVFVLLAIAFPAPPETAEASPSPSIEPTLSPSEAPSETPAATPTATPRPTATPVPIEDSVAQFGSQIPGLTAADVTINLEDRGHTCEGPNEFLDGVEYLCELDTDPIYVERVEIVGMSPTEIRSVESAYFWFGDPTQMDARADDFLGYMATLPYEGAAPADARTWVQANTSGTTTFGPATYELTEADLFRSLDIRGT